MKTSAYRFELPQDLIAQYPLENRSDSRLLVYSRHQRSIVHRGFRDLIELLQPGDLLVMNDSQVIPARLYGQKSTGGQVELLVERVLDDDCFWAHIRASKAPKPGTRIDLDEGFHVEVLEKSDALYRCKASGSVDTLLHAIGHVPLPGYIRRDDETMDLTRYQTVYAKAKGSVAAPTAGLHFDHWMLEHLLDKKIQIDFVTLHVGAGTFQPVRVELIHDHTMHREYFSVSEALCARVKATKEGGHRVIAVGTTALRCLESAAVSGELKPQSGDTAIFIYPGFHFQVCDGLITNFHLPESTLLMLVSAFIGYEETMRLYQVAVAQKYRFYSYGDASLLL